MEKDGEMEEDIDLEVTYCPRSDITEDAFQPKETIVVVREAPQEISETQEKSVKPTQSYLSMKHKVK